MTIDDAIKVRLNGSIFILKSGEFPIDFMIYTKTELDQINVIGLLEAGELNGEIIQEDRANRRKNIIKNILSKSFMKKIVGEEYEKVEKVAYFSYDDIYNVDYCYFVNLQNYGYKAFIINDNGHILISKSYKISEDYKSFKVYDFSEIFKQKYQPSNDIDYLFLSINNTIVLNSSTNESQKIYLGYKTNEIHENVIELGKANFDEGYKNLKAFDKVDLYCFFNMKKHYFSSYALFSIFYDVILSKEKINKINFIDIGCGPATSGLAFIELIKEKNYAIDKFSYSGIDSAKTMLEKASFFIDKLGYPYSFDFIDSIDNIKKINNPTEYLTLINCSYLFASKSLEAKELSEKFTTKFKKFDKIFILYQNSSVSENNKKWEEFKRHIPTIVHFHIVENVKYKRRRTPESNVYSELVRFEVVQILTNKFAI
jgi:hypothetical protein